MSVLTISNNEVLNLCRLDTADSGNITDVTEVISKGQDGYEAMIQPAVLADPSFQAFLRRTIAKLLAADLLGIRSRVEGGTSSLQGAGITVGKPDDLAGKLREEAGAVLSPYLRSWRPSGAITTPDESPASQSRQVTLFGPGCSGSE